MSTLGGREKATRSRGQHALVQKGRLDATDDGGFSPFSIDDRSLHGSPDDARDIAFQKIVNPYTEPAGSHPGLDDIRSLGFGRHRAQGRRPSPVPTRDTVSYTHLTLPTKRIV